MSKKDKNKSAKQFRISWPTIARAIWLICVVLLIVAMIISAGFALIALFVPPQKSTTDQLSPEVLQQLQEQIQSQTVTPTTVAP